MEHQQTTPRRQAASAAPAIGRLILAATLACFGLVAPVTAQEYPAKPVRLVVGYGAGSPPDIAARVIAAQMAGPLGQPIIVENKPGAIGVLAMHELLRQPADGYDILNMVIPILVGASFTKEAQIDPLRDFTAVGQYTWSNSVLVTGLSATNTSAKDLVDAVRARPRQFSFASGGYGTPAHLYGEMLNHLYQLDAVHVPYNQFPQAIVDLVGGRVNYMFLTSTAAVPNVRGGKLRAIAVAAEQRMASLPEVPTLAEQGIRDFDARSWDGLVVRTGTPARVIERLNRALNVALATSEVQERFATLGLDVVSGTPEQFGALLRRDSERFFALIRARNIKAQ